MDFAPLNKSTDYINWLAYGPEGTGKTCALAKAAKYGKVLVVNAEGGFKRIALEQHGIDIDNLFFYPPETGHEITNNDLVEVHKQILSDLDTDPTAWFAVGLDSITEIGNVLREQATLKRSERVRSNDPDFVDRADYGVMTNQMRIIVRRFRDLPCHVVLTALERFDEDSKERRPAITPALGTDVMGYMDIITAHKAGDPFRALTRNSGNIRAKDRFGVLPRVLVEPDFARVHDYVIGELTEENDPLQQSWHKAQREKALADGEK